MTRMLFIYYRLCTVWPCQHPC